ncbi:MAG: class I tRNA ligase family protein, partial [Streptomyces sp.]|nr:class I tRNA ligase family protein [Streptomyces sp.]
MQSETGPQSDTGPAHRYGAGLAGEIESRWQTEWAERGTFEAPNPVGPLADPDGAAPPEDKLFVQDMFPYPSGAGLHVGHPLEYIATDVFARYNRMLGTNVLHTLGYDAFGLPAEQYAVQTGQHPRVTTEANIANMERQLGRLGLGHDRRRVFATTDTDFYRWTQWIFLQIHGSWYDPEAPARAIDGGEHPTRTGRARPISELVEQFVSGARPLPGEHAGRDWAELSRAEQEKVLDAHRLVYLSDSTVNWCPGLGTVLANEEVTAEGRSERGNFPVFRKNLSQWMMRITAYADRLVDDLDRLDWTDKVKSMQRNWIGRSQGARVRFAVA